jgi:glucosamine--fructose-6-phosphate aminotransferase (isomerizing)
LCGAGAPHGYDGHLEASTAVELSTLLRLVGGGLPLSLYSSLTGRAGTPGVLLAHLVDATTRAIDELTRPIDAIKHQAKTVTVGISRTDEALMTVPLVKAVLEAGVERDALAYEDLKTLAALDPLVEAVTGFTRYRLDGEPASDESSIRVVERGGVARELRSRVEDNRQLRGTKRTMATEGRVLVSRGRSDQRTVMLVPEILGGQVVGLVLLHVDYVDTAEPGVLRGALEGYRHRWSLLRDAVMETEPVFDEQSVSEMRVESLLCDPIQQLAERLRQAYGNVAPVGDEE